MLATDCAAGGDAWRAGLAALAGGDAAAALPLLRQAVAAGEGGGLALLNLGLALMHLGRLDEAEAPLLQAAAALPGHAEPPFRLGTLAGLRGEADRASRYFLMALAREADHVPALAALAMLEEAGGRMEAASALIARARLIDPAEPELDVVAARLALAAEDPGAALAAASRVLARRPAHLAAARLLARAWL
ncbi:MAG: tetratricopeptide repeat protein, partial [Paracraurococcus sp.]